MMMANASEGTAVDCATVGCAVADCAGTSMIGRSPRAAGGGVIPRFEFAAASLAKAAFNGAGLKVGRTAIAAPCTWETKSRVTATGQAEFLASRKITQGFRKLLMGSRFAPVPR